MVTVAGMGLPLPGEGAACTFSCPTVETVASRCDAAVCAGAVTSVAAVARVGCGSAGRSALPGAGSSLAFRRCRAGGALAGAPTTTRSGPAAFIPSKPGCGGGSSPIGPGPILEPSAVGGEGVAADASDGRSEPGAWPASPARAAWEIFGSFSSAMIGAVARSLGRARPFPAAGGRSGPATGCSGFGPPSTGATDVTTDTSGTGRSALADTVNVGPPDT